MTIVLGIKCADGLVIACDSQVQFGRGLGVKRLNANKIYEIKNRFAMAGSGVVAHIEKVVESITAVLKEEARKKGTFLSEVECVDILERCLATLHKHYNIDRSGFLGVDEKEFFNPCFIFGGILEDEQGKNYCMSIIWHEGIVEPVSDYGTIGSGAAYAELIMKSYYVPGMTVNAGIQLASYVVDEVVGVDPSCGGPTKLASLTSEGFKEIGESQLLEQATRTREALNLVKERLITKILEGELDAEDIKKIQG